MGSGIYFPLSALLFSILNVLLFFSKKRISTTENKIYGILVITNLLGLIIELLCTVAAYIYNTHEIIANGILKAYLMYIVTWAILFMIYVFYISHEQEFIKKNKRKLVLACAIFYWITIFMTMLLPIELIIENNFETRYTTGPSVSFTYIISTVTVVVMLYCIIKNRKKLKSRKYIPLFTFLSLGSFFMFFQMINPQILVMTYMETFITMLMYHTIENPDMKLLEELHRSKEISDSANEEKTLFLYNMTQEIRNTMHEIDDDADIILDSKDWQETYDSARNIKASTSKFTSMANDILDVSKMDAANLKVYNNKYNIKTVIKEIVSIYDNICKEKELTFRTNIDHDIPDILYGDSINLKEVLNIILNNSVKYTDKGYIELNINTIIKNDICRLIITIEDSGTGIKSDDIDKLKVDDKSLSKANKLITLMNGAMTISSNFGLGTKVKIILDQKVELNKNSEITKYDIEFKNTKILMVDDSESGIKIIEKLLKGTNIKIDTSNNGKECIDMIKAYKYDLILLDEELTQITGIELLKKIKDIRNFNTPVILLTKDNSYEYNEEYLSFGFKDYILKPIKKEDLLNKINKIVNKDN